MTVDELKERLSGGPDTHRGFSPYPMPPTAAAALIVAELLADLPEERRAVIRDVISEWAGERESAVSYTAMESGER